MARHARDRDPKRRDGASPTRPDGGRVDEPPIMWPSEGSGFEADPFSPSGLAQQEWVLATHLSRRRGGKIVIWIVLVLLVVSLVSPLFNLFR